MPNYYRAGVSAKADAPTLFAPNLRRDNDRPQPAQASGAPAPLLELPVAPDNYVRFSQLCRAYRDRDRRLASATVKAGLGGASRVDSVLDIGTADGRLLFATLNLLAKRDRLPLFVRALEPDALAGNILRSAAAKRHEPLLGDACRITSLQQYLASVEVQEQFDLITASHVLYHFQDWQEVTNRLLERLRPNGRLVVILDSRNTPLYSLRDDFYAISNAATEHSGYGSLHFAEDFAQMLRIGGYRHSRLVQDTALCFTWAEVPEQLFDVLTFIYRFPVAGSAKTRRLVDDSLATFGTEAGLEIPWRDEIFSVQAS